MLYLDAIDGCLLVYLDEDDELPSRGGPTPPPLRQRLPRRLRHAGSSRRGLGRLFDLVGARRRRLRPRGADELNAEASPLMSNEVETDTVLSAAHGTYLAAVELLLDA